jgi:hypothetical protein
MSVRIIAAVARPHLLVSNTGVSVVLKYWLFQTTEVLCSRLQIISCISEDLGPAALIILSVYMGPVTRQVEHL